MPIGAARAASVIHFTRPAVPSLLAQFDRLSTPKKLDRLYPGYRPEQVMGLFAPAADLQVQPAALLPASVRRKAGTELARVGQEAQQHFGSAELQSLRLKGTTLAYVIRSTGDEQGGWWRKTRIYDRNFNFLGDFGYSE